MNLLRKKIIGAKLRGVFRTKAKNGDVLLRHVNSSNGYYDGDVSISCDSNFKEPVDEQ